jgi:hypothetical protein
MAVFGTLQAQSAGPSLISSLTIDGPLVDLVFRSATDGTALSASHVWRTTDGGETWTSELLRPLWPALTAIDYIGASGTIVSDVKGNIHVRSNAGANWMVTQPMELEGGESILDLVAIDSARWVALTDYHVIYTDNAGASYRVDSIDELGLYKALDVLSDSVWHVGGGSGNVWRTEDAGRTWRLFDRTVLGHIYDVKFVDENLGFVCSWYPWAIFRTTDGAETWSQGPYEYPVTVDVAQSGIGAYATAEYIRTTIDHGGTWSDSTDFPSPASESGDHTWGRVKVVTGGDATAWVMLSGDGLDSSRVMRLDNLSDAPGATRRLPVEMDLSYGRYRPDR